MAPSVCQYRTAPSVGLLKLSVSSENFSSVLFPRDAQVDFVTSDVSGVSDVEQKQEAGMERPLVFKVRTFG